MKKFILLGIFAFTLGLTPLAYAEHSQGHQCPMGDKCMSCKEKGDDYACPVTGKIIKKAKFLLNSSSELGLSEDQINQIKNIKIQAKKAAIREQADMEIFMLDLEARLSQDKVDVTELNAIIDKTMPAMAQSLKDKIQAYVSLKAILSAEQKARAKALHQSKDGGSHESKTGQSHKK